MNSKLWIAIGLFALASPAWATPEQDKAAVLCDALVASVDDKTNPPDIKGVEFSKIDGKAALKPCAAAYAAFPDKSRYAFQYGRAMDASGNSTKAFSLIETAAKAGHAVAMVDLGYYYEYGLGTEKDLALALEWYLKGAALDIPYGAWNAGLLYRDGGTGVVADGAQAEKWLIKAGELGLPGASVDLGYMYETGKGLTKDEAKALHFYQEGEKGGNFDAKNNIGVFYEMGKGGLKEDKAKAVEFYHAAAEGGNARGMRNLGRAYMQGIGVKQDLTQGLAWTNNAHAAGSSDASFDLGEYYDEGQGVAPDPVKAAGYYIIALERKDPVARRALIENAGKDLSVAAIDALQAALIKRGGKFAKQKGSLNTAAIAYMTQLFDGT